MPPRAASAEQAPHKKLEQIAAALEEFLSEHARAVVLEDGRCSLTCVRRSTSWRPNMADARCICGARSAISSGA